MRETWVRSLGQEDAVEKEMATHSSTLAWRIPWMEELVGSSPWGCKESDTTEQLHFTSLLYTMAWPSWQTKLIITGNTDAAIFGELFHIKLGEEGGQCCQSGRRGGQCGRKVERLQGTRCLGSRAMDCRLWSKMGNRCRVTFQRGYSACPVQNGIENKYESRGLSEESQDSKQRWLWWGVGKILDLLRRQSR